MSLAYLDSSAYLSIVLGEKQSANLANSLKKFRLCTSSILFLECERNLVRLSRENHIRSEDASELLTTLKKDSAKFIVKDMGLDLCFNQKYPIISIPRSLDLIHLRTALWFQEKMGSLVFVTLDKIQERAAIDLGLMTTK